MKKLLTITLSCLSLTSFAESTIIPAGSHGSAILQSNILLTENESSAVSLLINGVFALPNSNHSSALEHCSATGYGKSNFSTNRITIRIDQMYCGDKKYQVTGFIVDKDKKDGVIAESKNNMLSVSDHRNVTIILTNGVILEKQYKSIN